VSDPLEMARTLAAQVAELAGKEIPEYGLNLQRAAGTEQKKRAEMAAQLALVSMAEDLRKIARILDNRLRLRGEHW
jgi:hypothetical protein